MNPLISIIVPVYKSEPYIARCIESVLSQTFEDFELILVDDGSPDKSGEICDYFAQKDDRIHVIHQENKGACGAYNSGIDYALISSDSKYLTFIDGDDFIHPRYLEILYLPIENGLADISSCRGKPTFDSVLEITDEQIKSTPPKIYTVEDYYCKRTMDCIHIWGKIYQKSAFSTLRFPKEIVFADDVFTTFRAIFQNKSIAFVFLPLYGYFQSPNSMVRSEWSLNRMEAFEGYEEQTIFFEKNGYNEAAKISANTHFYYILDSMTHIYGDNLINVTDKDLHEQKTKLTKQFHQSRKHYFKYLNAIEKVKVFAKYIAIKTGFLTRRNK